MVQTVVKTELMTNCDSPVMMKETASLAYVSGWVTRSLCTRYLMERDGKRSKNLSR